MNFMLPVPDASLPAVEICSDRSAAGYTSCAFFTLKFGKNTTLMRPATTGSEFTVSATPLISRMISLAIA